MLARLLLLFVCVPLVELALLLSLARLTAVWFTLMLVVVTGVVGTLLARSQGLRTYRRIHDELSAGRMPTDSLLDAAMIFVAGALLLTPGILTDILGMSLLIPGCRRFYRRKAADWIKSHFKIQTFTSERQSSADSQVIDSYVVGSSGEAQGPRGEHGG